MLISLLSRLRIRSNRKSINCDDKQMGNKGNKRHNYSNKLLMVRNCFSFFFLVTVDRVSEYHSSSAT